MNKALIYLMEQEYLNIINNIINTNLKDLQNEIIYKYINLNLYYINHLNIILFHKKMYYLED